MGYLETLTNHFITQFNIDITQFTYVELVELRFIVLIATILTTWFILWLLFRLIIYPILRG
jgi:hypothetical protein